MDSRALGTVQDSLQNLLNNESLSENATPVKTNRKNSKNIQAKKEKTTEVINNNNFNTKEESSNSKITIVLIAAVIIFMYFYFLGAQGTTRFQGGNSNPDTWKRMTMSRRDYYNEVYLKSEEWQRKRYLVLKRDNWRCVYCGEPATEVHHKRYAKKNIGKEPIDWLVSICKPCHRSEHNIENPPNTKRWQNWGWEKLS